MMNILLVNDDGIKAKGLQIAAQALEGLGKIYIAAPLSHQSGKSQAITISGSLKVKDFKNLYGSIQAYAINGTPADCVRLALYLFKDVNFDLIVSGINKGANLGMDVLHSGTVGAASEGASMGIKALAISSPYGCYNMASTYSPRLIKALIENNFISSDYVLNINFPHKRYETPNGIMFTNQGYHRHKPSFKKLKKNSYQPLHELFLEEEKKTSDVFCYEKGIISLTPIFEDRSKEEVVKELNKKSQLNELLIYDKIK